MSNIVLPSPVAWPPTPSSATTSQVAAPVTPSGNAGGTPTPQLKALKKACEQFEAVFAKQLLGEMRKSIQKAKLGGDETGGEIYKDMMDQTMADSMAHQGALGIGQMLYKQFEKAVGGSNPIGPINPISEKTHSKENDK